MDIISKNKGLYQRNFLVHRIFLDTEKAHYWITELFSWLFATKAEFVSYTHFEQKETALQYLLQTLLQQEQFTETAAAHLSRQLFAALNEIHLQLTEDLSAVLQSDPAAKSTHEVLLSYPGFFAVAIHRIAHYLWQQEVFILARLIAEIAHSKTGIDIHPAATIGKRFFIDHGTGVVIGETTVIGNEVTLYQGVTLGALSVRKDKADKKRHPTIADQVTIYANATILGGDTHIGTGAIIGGNVWITESVPPQTMVFHKSEMIVKAKPSHQDSINFSI
ncbi:serine O-acetyltransferase EpsC [Taibaiella sp. KBW10]|uniref:serine O-acetyltransferase EpsC n=1 Tax=Taibaiella sp. KBW10 TaxID=2153357 RepID=UPI001F2565C9|nr:serine O-acetyltransferase EpsC [Taibaiella sp. KBW10]